MFNTQKKFSREEKPKFIKQISKTQKKSKELKLRIIPLGGQEEVGRNMTVFEYGDDIVIVDMGIQFPEEDMPGIDYIIPNISYLKGKSKNIRGVIFTHGHLDHIGAAPILLRELGYPPIIGKKLSIALIKRRLEDQDKGSVKNLKVIELNSSKEKIQLGKFRFSFFEVEHSIMDSIGIVLNTPAATAIHMGDWTLGIDSLGKKINYGFLSKFPRPTILMLESLGSTHKEKPVSEKEMWENLTKIIHNAPARIIIGTFSSQVKRVRDILYHAREIGKKVALDGYSIKANIEVVRELGYIKGVKEVLIPIKNIAKYPPKKVIVVCTGAQGEGNAVLSRIVTGSHKFVKLAKNDTIIFSSSVIPGNERTIQRLKDSLYRRCDNVIHGEIMDVHMGGHSNIFAIKEVVRQIKPNYFLPVYANHYFLKEAEKIVRQDGFLSKNIFVLDNGHIAEFNKKEVKINPKKVDTSHVFVDGLGVGDVGQIVLRDRKQLSQDGMFTIVVIVDEKGRLMQDPDVMSRGFVYMKESGKLLDETKQKIKEIVIKKTKEMPLNWSYVKANLRNDIGEFLYKKTQRRPMVIPIVIEI